MIAKKNLLIPSLLALLLTTETLYAERGGFRGGNPGINHGNDTIHRGYDNAQYRRGYDYNPEAVILAPGDEACTTTQICNTDGQCWSEQNC